MLRMDRTKIAFFLPNLAGGGAEKVSINLLREMVKYKNLQIDLLLGNAEGDFIDDVPEGVNVIDLKTNRVLKTLPALIMYLRNSKPYSLLSHISHTNVVALLAKRISNTNVRVFVVEHNNLSARNTFLLRKRMLRPLMKWLYPSAEHVVAVSEGVANTIHHQLKLNQTKIVTIYNPVVMPEIFEKMKVDLPHQWLNENTIPVFLAVGRFTEQKDFSNLLEAFATTLKSIQAKLIILGDGKLRAELERKIATLDLNNHVSMPGFSENPYSFMSRATCFARNICESLSINHYSIPDNLDQRVGERRNPMNTSVLRSALSLAKYLRKHDMHVVVNLSKKLGLIDFLYSKSNPIQEKIDGGEEVFSIVQQDSIRLKRELDLDISHWESIWSSSEFQQESLIDINNLKV